MIKWWKPSLLAVATFAITAMIGIADGAVTNGDPAHPTLKSMPAPDYPPEARDAKIEGRVLVRALVGADGRIDEVFFDQGDEIFAASAIEAVSGALFEPATKDGEPVAVWVSIPIRFELD
jgi:protein TonB